MLRLRTTVAAAALAGLAAALFLALPAGAQAPMRGGMTMDPSHQQDMQVFHYLLEHRAQIARTVTNLPNGIETTTLSDNPDVADKLRVHVAAMITRVEQGRPIHARDPLFAELFRHARHVVAKVEPLPTGVRVIETSDDAYTVGLLQEHARVLNLFLANGMSEVHKNHTPPKRPGG